VLGLTFQVARLDRFCHGGRRYRPTLSRFALLYALRYGRKGLN